MVSYLGRNDLAHVPPGQDEDIGDGVEENPRGATREVVRKVTSNGFVRGRFGSIGVKKVRGGAQPKMMEEHAPHMVHAVLEVRRRSDGDDDRPLRHPRRGPWKRPAIPVGDLMAAVGTALIQRTEAAIEKKPARPATPTRRGAPPKPA